MNILKVCKKKFMSRILLIGNSGFKKHGTDGQTVKVRFYLKKIVDEGFDITFVDLENFLKKPISSLLKIKRGIKACDRIVLISAKRGCKILIPYINRINRKYRRVFVLPLVGTSVLHYSIDKLSNQDKNKFILNKNYSLCNFDHKFSRELSRINYVLPETDSIVDVFKGFYRLNNVYKLNNVRESVVLEESTSKDTGSIKLIFLSRVMREKGVFDLLEVAKPLIDEHKNVSLDIYGKKFLSKNEIKLFNSFLAEERIKYKGAIMNDSVCSVLSKYDLLVFPTRFVGEGTPGVIVESLISGTPVLTVDFPQAHLLLNDGVDSVFCKMFDKEDLKSKLLYIINNKDVLQNLRKGAFESGKNFTYDHERKLFLKYVCGVEEEQN